MSSKKRVCAECEFYESQYRKCHFNPPIYQYVVKQNGNVEQEGGWPHVRDEEWCGKFKAKNNKD